VSALCLHVALPILVGVMLVLLIIFMVTAPMLASGVPVELPESRANALDQQPDQVTIAIVREGFIYIDDTRVAPGAFASALSGVNCGGAGAPLRSEEHASEL